MALTITILVLGGRAFAYFPQPLKPMKWRKIDNAKELPYNMWQWSLGSLVSRACHLWCVLVPTIAVFTIEGEVEMWLVALLLKLLRMRTFCVVYKLLEIYNMKCIIYISQKGTKHQC
jgi:hypothetical protein